MHRLATLHTLQTEDKQTTDRHNTVALVRLLVRSAKKYAMPLANSNGNLTEKFNEFSEKPYQTESVGYVVYCVNQFTYLVLQQLQQQYCSLM